MAQYINVEKQQQKRDGLFVGFVKSLFKKNEPKHNQTDKIVVSSKTFVDHVWKEKDSLIDDGTSVDLEPSDSISTASSTVDDQASVESASLHEDLDDDKDVIFSPLQMSTNDNKEFAGARKKECYFELKSSDNDQPQQKLTDPANVKETVQPEHGKHGLCSVILLMYCILP